MEVKIDDFAKDMGSSDPKKSFKATQSLIQLAIKSQGDERSQLAKAIASAIAEDEPEKNVDERTRRQNSRRNPEKKPRYSANVRRELARALSLVADDGCMEALASAASDLDTNDSVRYVLERANSAKSTETILTLLKSAFGSTYRVGLVNALGTRSGENVVGALKELLNDADRAVMMAAGDALGKQADPSVDAALVAAIKKLPAGKGKVNGHGPAAQLAKARVRHAHALASAGQKDAAKKVLQDLSESVELTGVLKAAKIGLEQLAKA